MNKVFYHARDLDGKCSGASLKYFLEKENKKVELIPLDYGDPIDITPLEGCDVWFVDIAPEPEGELLKIRDIANSIFVIDHHKSARGFLYENDIPGYYEPKSENDKDIQSACEMVWEYMAPSEDIPLPVKLVSAYDIWDHRDQTFWDAAILPFQLGLKSYEADPIANYDLWVKLFESGQSAVDDLIKEGTTISKFQSQFYSNIVKAGSFEAYFDTFRCICCNMPMAGSLLFDSVYDKNCHDIMMAFNMDVYGKYTVSIYTKKEGLDLSVIAKKYGGGGHKGAAGFTAKSFRFENGQILLEI